MIDTLVLIDDTRTTIYHDIICDVTPESRQKIRQKQIERDPTTLLRSTICFWLLAFTLFLACPLSGLFCRHFVVHQLDTSSCYGLTVPLANSNPIPSQLGLLPERMFVFDSFINFSSCCLLLLSRCEVHYLIYRCYWRSRALFLVQYHVVVEREVVDVVYTI